MKFLSLVSTLLASFMGSAFTAIDFRPHISAQDRCYTPAGHRPIWYLFIVLASFLCGANSAWAGWINPPPSSVAVGTSVSVQFTVTFPSGTPPTYGVMWLQNPSGAWSKVFVAGGSPGGTWTTTISQTLSTLGTYNWRATGESNASVTTPTGATQFAATTTVILTPTTFTISPTSFTYNGSAQGPTITPSPSNATWSVTAGQQSATSPGSYSTTATANGSFTGTSGSVSWTINKAGQSAVSITSGSSFTYGGSYTATASGGNGTGAIVWGLGAGSTATGANIDPSTGAVTASSVGTVVIHAYRAGDSNYYQAATTSDFPVTVNPIAATFSLSATGFTFNGSAQGPTISATPAGATFTPGGTMSATNAGGYTATATATGNYTGSNSSLSWSIGVANQTISFNNPGTQNFRTPLTLNATASSGLPPAYTVASGPATVTNNVVTFTGTGSVRITASQAGNSNYNAATSVDQTFTVNPAATTFALNQASFTYDGIAKAPTIVTTPSGASFTPGGTLSATNVGSYTATATATGYYSGSNSSLVWSIASSGQTTTFSNPGTQTYGTKLNLTASASSGLPVTFTVTSGPATIAGIAATFTGAGTVTIKASQGGNSNYGAAPDVSQSFSVIKANPAKAFVSRTLQTGMGSGVYFVTSADLNASFTNAGNGSVAQPTGTVAYTIATGSPNGTAGTAITNSSQLLLGTYYIQASYPGDANYNATSIVATWTVKAPAALASQLGLGSQTNVEQNDTNNATTGLKVNRPQ